MSAVPQPRQPLLLPMSLLHLDAVMAIEAGAYPFPWTHGNFVDSLAAGYDARVLYDDQGAILGYFVAMAGVEEMHLLNITVAPRAWHQGHGRFMLDALEALCHERGARQLWLEVRVSNERARAIYRRRGFAEVGIRRKHDEVELLRLITSLDVGDVFLHPDAGGQLDGLGRLRRHVEGESAKEEEQCFHGVIRYSFIHQLTRSASVGSDFCRRFCQTF